MNCKLAWIAVLFGIVVSPHLAACGEPHYPIKDSKFPAAEAKLGWIDNERVIFHGYEIGKVGQPSLDDGHPMAETGLFIWNIPKNTVTKYWDIDGITPLCVFHDHVWFLLRIKGDEKARLQVSGRIGHEQQTKTTGEGALNGVSCNYHIPKPEWADERRVRRPLLEEHGYLDFGPWANADRSDSANILLYRPNEKDPVRLPLNPNQVENLFEYVEFENAYLFQGQRQTTYAAPVWLLKPNGALITILEPTGQPWEKLGWGQYTLTKKGLFLAGGSGRYDQVGTMGGYLHSGGKPQRLIAGITRNISVSPDGCKVAFVHILHSWAGAESAKALRQGKPGSRTLKMIDVCAEKGE
jgi:hypothetical protein